MNHQVLTKARPYALTPQEINVLTLLVQGQSYKMIAASLLIGFETVKSHMRNLYWKLDVKSATEAVSKALREGLVRF